jgi:hypothetical protein
MQPPFVTGRPDTRAPRGATDEPGNAAEASQPGPAELEAPLEAAPAAVPRLAPEARSRLALAASPPSPAPTNGADATVDHGTTAPQLRRFIKSRAYVPMHELRRRFAINGSEDDVTPLQVDSHRVYVGLPEREGRLLGELLRGGDIGYELSLDPISPVVVGVYPMRPVSRS